MTKKLKHADDTRVILLESYRDYDLEHGAWFTMGNISVWLRKTDEGVVCDMYALDHEADDPSLAMTYAFFAEAQAIIDEAETKKGNRQ